MTEKPVAPSVDTLRARVASAADELQKALKDATPEERSSLLQQVDALTRQNTPAVAPVAQPQAAPTGVEQPVTDVATKAPNAQPTSPLGVEKPMTAEEQARYISGVTQPRDSSGKFRKVLALIKENLGTSGNQGVLNELEKTQQFENVGDYTKAANSAVDLIDTIDRLDSGALNAKSLENVRLATQDLGKVIANLPLPFDAQAEKLRYSDLPPTLRDLVETMITKVEAKIGKKEADAATAELRGFMSGSDVYSQAEISSQMNRMLRLLT
jgi:hypothetical protein